MSELKKCSECEYCEEYRKLGNIRSSFSCEHPDRSYIAKYFREHNIRKMEGFLGFGAKFSSDVPIKTAPAWCPRKKPMEQEGIRWQKKNLIT